MTTLTYDKPVVLKRGTPSRPPLFSFLIHIVHLIRGYNPANAFVLNFLVFSVLLFFIGLLLRGPCGPASAAAAMVLAAAQPIISITAASGHYDVFFALFVVLCVHFLRVFLKNPGPITLDLLWANLVVLASIRHESFLYAGLVLLVLLMAGRLSWRHLRDSWAVALTPFLLLPIIWHSILTYAPLRSLVPKGTEPFALEHFVRQNISFIRALGRFDYRIPIANSVVLLGLAGLIFFLCRRLIGKKKPDPTDALLFGTIATMIGLIWAVFTSSFWGDITHPASSRFYIVPLIFVSAAAAVFLSRLCSNKVVLVSAAVALWALYHPIAVFSRESFTLPVWKEYRFVVRYLNGLPDRDFVLVAEQPHKYAIYDFGAVSFAHARNKRKALLTGRATRVYRDILILQHLDHPGMKPSRGSALDESYELETMLEKQISPWRFVRISRVVN